MGKETLAVYGSDRVPRGLRDATKRVCGARRERADVFRDQCPDGFDGIEVIRYGGRYSTDASHASISVLTAGA